MHFFSKKKKEAKPPKNHPEQSATDPAIDTPSSRTASIKRHA
jgi:hypothetical protein